MTRRRKPDDAPPWPEAVDLFSAALVAAERSALTIAGYRDSLARFAAWHEATFREPPVLPLLSAADLRDWKRHQSETLRHSPKSVNTRLAALASFLEWCEAREWTIDLAAPKYVPEQRKGPQWLTVPEERALYRAVDRAGDRRAAAVIYTLAKAGLRVFELAALDCRDLAIGPRKGELVVRKGKGAKQRAVPLHVQARTALVAYLEGRAAGPVFRGQRGPLTTSGVQKIVEGYSRAIRVDLSPHTLRHTCAKRLVDAGTPLHVVARILGHESTKTTEIYVEPSREDLQSFVDRLPGGED